ncbi:hypothetical protein MJH12_13025 [bacterium]|nr:hypothetical protein [bacterium]
MNVDRAISLACLILVVYILVIHKSETIIELTNPSSKLEVRLDIRDEMIETLIDNPAFEEKLSVMISSMLPANNGTSQPNVRVVSTVDYHQANMPESMNSLISNQLSNSDQLYDINNDIDNIKADLLNLASDSSFQDSVRDVQRNYLSETDRMPGGAVMEFFGVPEFIPNDWQFCTGFKGTPSLSSGKLRFKSYRDIYFTKLCKSNPKLARPSNLSELINYQFQDQKFNQDFQRLVNESKYLYSSNSNEKKKISSRWVQLLGLTYDDLEEAIASNQKLDIVRASKDYDIIHRAYFSYIWNFIQK